MSKWMLFLICCVLIVIIGFFLPWVKPLPEDATKDAMKLKENILAYEPSLISDYILVRERDLADMQQMPTEGASGYQMAFSHGAHQVTQTASQYLFGTEQPDWRVKFFAVAPILAFISLLIFLKGDAPRPWWMGLIAAQFVFYFVMRWILSQGQLIHMEMSLGLGLWMTLYGTLLLAVAHIVMLTQANKN